MRWVLLVPGFAASHLFRFDNGGDRGVKIWLSQLDVAWGGISDLDTDPQISPTNLDVVRPGSPLYEVYQPFLGWCARQGIAVQYFGYDWRADVQTNGQRLADFIADRSNINATYTIVAHSMGGLVAAAAANKLTDEAATRVERVITCGTPWAGSYRTLELFAGTHEIVAQVVALNSIFSRRSRYQWLQEALRVVASWPGAYDLLPMPEMMRAYPPGPGQDFTTGDLLGRTNQWFNPQRYFEAVARRPINVGFPERIVHHNWRGIGRPTVGPSPTVRDGYPDYWLKALLGDSAVPEFSSHAPTVFNAVRRDFDADHEQFLNNGDVLLALGRTMGVLG